MLTSGKCALVIDLDIDGPDPGNEQTVDGLIPFGFPVSGSEKKSKNAHYFNQKNPAKFLRST
jgi:hypothetical protein